MSITHCRARPVACVWVILQLAVAPAFAEPRFDDVTAAAGISHAGPTAGASWGDLNGDGWPDLWIGNHRFGAAAPVLLINGQDGTFRDISSEITGVGKDADPHGAAWADFDGDGDQDLIVLAGGGAGRGSNPNHLFRNDGGTLVDVAAQAGLVSPLGRGRTPVWLDANNDGVLDVLISNKPRPDDRAPTTLFVQSSGHFTPISPPLAFAPTPRSRFDDLLYRARHGFNFRSGDFGSIETLEVFAQLADVNGDRRMDLIAYDQPTRVYELSGKTPREISDDLYLGTETNVSDAAIEDFDGDLRFDFYLARERAGTPDVVQSASNVLKAAFRGSRKKEPYQLLFSAAGQLQLQIIDPWEVSERLPPVRIGREGRKPQSLTFTLDADDPTVAGAPADRTGQDEIQVHYDPESKQWAIANWGRPIQVVARSLSGPITNVEPVGFKPSKGKLPDHLLVQQDDGFGRMAYLGSGTAVAACSSVAAGDFDNDMDVDVYLVCSDPVRNVPNILLENLGDGRMREVPDAGGAAGTDLGRGDAVAVADYDRDGFLDLFVTNGAGSLPFSDDGPYQLFHNHRNGNHWIEIDLTGTRSNRDGIGAVVELTSGGKSQIREQSNGIHSFSQNHARLHFGLGDNRVVDQIEVWWPSGTRQKLADVPADQILAISEPDPSGTH